MSTTKDYKEYYRTPERLQGEIVFWYAGGDTTSAPYAAIVNKVNISSLCLHILVPTHPYLRVIDGARHCKETINEYERADAGCWEWREERMDRLAEVRRRREEAAALADLEAEEARRQESKRQEAVTV